MTYIPTKEELEEMGLTPEGKYEYNTFGPHMVCISYDNEFMQWAMDTVTIYPQSIEDIKTLIRILTPQ